MASFQSLSEKLQEAMKRLRRKGSLTEADVKEALREVRRALLEADVNLKVVKDFVARVQERAVGEEVLKSLTPGQQVIKIVNEELTALMGGSHEGLNLGKNSPDVILFAGLQGSGKTTSVAKLAARLRKEGKRPLMVAADVYRPAAIKQLEVLASKIDVPLFQMGDGVDPVQIARGGLEHARKNAYDPVLIDTAGRLHIDDQLMRELEQIKEVTNPAEILLVVDAMTGQDAVNVAQTMNERLLITGVIITKLDGDTRGGAALSVKAVTNRPVKFVGTGEKIEALEPFYPDRMASRILGMGDVLSLIEKAEKNLDAEKAREMQRKMMQQQFTLEDFLEQMQQVKSMGSLEEILGMLPGVNAKELKGLKLDEKELTHVEAMIQSMTPQERQNPQIINGSRKKRIAAGSGTKVQEVNRLLKQFSDSRRLMQQLGGKTSKAASKKMAQRMGKKGGMGLPFIGK